MNEARIIKRYANRKLYDTQHSRYVTLDQISEMIRNGDEVKIIDNKTKEDLTKVTLAQIIFEEEKKQRSFLSLQTMRNIIQNGGESLSHFVSEAQRRVTSMLPLRKDGDDRDGDDDDSAMAEGGDSHGSDGAAGGHDDSTGKRRDGLSSLRELREWVQEAQHSIEEWHRRVDDRIRNMVEGFSPFSGLQKEIKVLRARLAELEAKLSGVAQRKPQDSHADNAGVGDQVKDGAEPAAVGSKPAIPTDPGN